MKINRHYLELKPSYLFKTIAQKTAEYQTKNPSADIIRMGIGDVTRPICASAVNALKAAADEMGKAETFHGYPESYGEDFLLSAIEKHYKNHIGADVSADEIVVTSGAKEDTANILDIFDTDNTVLIPDPVYPVYLDTNIMTGRKVKYAPGNEKNAFLPMPEEAADIIYICSPNNPTGSAYNKRQLKEWVDFANEHGSVILFDAAYEMFVSDPGCPRSIFQIEGARTCAIEFCSFSKTAGFTGLRCGYTVIPKELQADGVSLLELWKRRQSTKFNGISYVIQRAAEAAFSDEGYGEIRKNIDYYRKNTEYMMSAFDEIGLKYFGGKNSPYVWLKTPNGMTSWEFFDFMLEKCNIIGTPGSGFGEMGEGYFRLSGFGTHKKTLEALLRMKNIIE